MEILNQIPDGVKVGASLSAPVLTFFGITLEDWTYILSIVVSILFIIEKVPTVIMKLKQFRNHLKSKKNASKE